MRIDTIVCIQPILKDGRLEAHIFSNNLFAKTFVQH